MQLEGQQVRLTSDHLARARQVGPATTITIITTQEAHRTTRPVPHLAQSTIQVRRPMRQTASNTTKVSKSPISHK